MMLRSDGRGETFEEVVYMLGNSPALFAAYEKWSAGRQARIDSLMERVYFQAPQAEKVGHNLGTAEKFGI